MQPENPNTKKIIIGVGVFVVAVVAIWFFFFRNTEVAPAFDDFGNPIVSQVVGKDLIDILAELQSVTLDSGIFKTAGFVNLTDFAIDIPDQPRKNGNPFESLHGGAGVPAVTLPAASKKN